MSEFAGLPQDVWDRVLARVLARHQSGEPRQVIAVPALKADFPKLLCLDLNKWVDLGRAHYGLPEGHAFKEALAGVLSAVRDGRLVVPITVENVLEVGTRRDEGSRRRLAEFMVALSGGHSIRNSVVVESLELDQAIGKLFRSGPVPELPLRPHLVQRGLGAAMVGGTPVLASDDEADRPRLPAIQEALLEPEVLLEILSLPTSNADLVEYRENNASVAAYLDGLRRRDPSLSVEARRQLELLTLFDDGITADRLGALLARRGIDPDQFYAWLGERDNRLRLSQAVPGFHVLGTLQLHKDRDLGNPSDPNDGTDIFFLRVAIPYANMVVTERSWAHLARVTGLAQEYGTVVIADLRELPEILTSQGCIGWASEPSAHAPGAS